MHLHIIKWEKENGLGITTKIFITACRRGHPDVAEWLLGNYFAFHLMHYELRQWMSNR